MCNGAGNSVVQLVVKTEATTNQAIEVKKKSFIDAHTFTS